MGTEVGKGQTGESPRGKNTVKRDKARRTRKDVLTSRHDYWICSISSLGVNK